MSSSTGAAHPVFSYAQAAKGLASAASTQSTSKNEKSSTSEKSVKDRAASSTHAPTALSSPQTRSELESNPSAESIAPADIAQEAAMSTSAVGQDADTESPSQNQHTSTNDNAHQSLPPSDVSTPQMVPRQDACKDGSTQQLSNGRKASSDEASLTNLTAVIDRTPPEGSEKKSKESEDDWEKVSVPSIAAESQYKAAPVPAVNVWQARKEAQAAKLKELADHQRLVADNPSQPQISRSSSEDFKHKPDSKEVSSIDKESKAIEGSRAGHRRGLTTSRSSRPASQHAEKAHTGVPPTVVDAQLWPTPENSTVDESRKSASYDKSDSKTGPQKPHGNKWELLNFVPTAKFETQLPPAAARRGRGGARGARDTGGRGGGHSATLVEKQDLPSSMGPPSLPRQSGEHDRGRRSEGHRSARGVSVPTSSNRPTSGDDSGAPFRKPSVTYSKAQFASDNVQTVSATVQQSAGDHAPGTQQSSRSSSRHTGNITGRVANGEKFASTEQASGVFTQYSDPVIRYSYVDRTRGSTTLTSRGNGEPGRDRGPGRTRDWSKDKPESAREKVESWRDRESSGDPGARREGRSDRGHGGYRGGRSNHVYNPPFPSSHAYTSPLPQNGFEPPSRTNSHPESRSRQASQPFVPSQATTSTRTNPRSQSIPVGKVFPGYYDGMQAMPQGLSAIQTDMSMYGYLSQGQMQPSIMSAMPYNDPLNSFALLSMVMTQM